MNIHRVGLMGGVHVQYTLTCLNECLLKVRSDKLFEVELIVVVNVVNNLYHIQM